MMVERGRDKLELQRASTRVGEYQLVTCRIILRLGCLTQYKGESMNIA